VPLREKILHAKNACLAILVNGAMTGSMYLGIDQGSSSTKGVLVDASGQSVADFTVAVPPRVENERTVEQDAEGLLSSVVEVVLKAKQWASANDAQLVAAGLAVQRSGVLAWRAADGVPLHPMMTWADTRTFSIIQSFGPYVERISEITGLPTLANFAAGKIHLLQRKFLEPSVKVGTLETFILYRLSGRNLFATEETMAARTMLYGIATGTWSERLCRDFKVDLSRLAPIRPSFATHTTFEGIPFVAVMGDQQAAVLGRPGERGYALLNLGTIASLLVETGERIVQKTGVMTSVLFSREDPTSKAVRKEYLAETTSAVTGTVLMEPLRRGWCSDLSELHTMSTASYEANPDGIASAYFVNHRPSPPWHPERTPNASFCKAGATVADKVRAVVENVGNLIVRMIEELQDKGLLGPGENNEIVVTGGGSELDYLLQYISDVSGRTLHRMPTREATARGAALAALVYSEKLPSTREFTKEPPKRSYQPDRPERRRRYMMWQKLEQDLFHGLLPSTVEVEP
jgi:glycerol kinase